MLENVKVLQKITKEVAMKIPKESKDFTVDWLNEALSNWGKLGNNEVTGCKAIDSDIPGQTAEIVLLDVSYKNTLSELPHKMVAKIASETPWYWNKSLQTTTSIDEKHLSTMSSLM